MRKRFSKICSLVVFGMFVMLVLAQSATAASLNLDPGDWVGLSETEARITFGTEGTPDITDEIYMEDADVGIGTDSPNEKLDVNGRLHMRDNIKLNGNWLSNDGDDEGIYVGSDGKVGIGTTNLVRELNVAGNIRAQKDYYHARLELRSWGNEYWVQVEDLVFDGIGFYRQSTSTWQMVLTTGGNLGIGTTYPTQTLHVAGNARITGALYDSNNDAGQSGQILQTTGSRIDWVDSSSIDDGDWTISGNNMYSAVSGYVGIGTTNPDERLHIDADSELQIVHLENDNGHYYINGESLRNRIISRDSSDTGYKDLQISTGSSDSGLGIYLETSGDVGIGTTTPDEKLEVEWDTNVDVEIGRGTTDADITFIALRNADGEKTYIYPNADQNGLHVTPTHP